MILCFQQQITTQDSAGVSPAVRRASSPAPIGSARCLRLRVQLRVNFQSASFPGVFTVACPYFMPTERLFEGAWIHPARLPLGSGWLGHCTAPGHEGVTPEAETLHQNCTLGYASSCPRLPAQRDADAIRFSVLRENESRISLIYVFERNHEPAGHGNLEFRVQDRSCVNAHADARIQKMAECYLESWLSKSRTDSGHAPDPSHD